MPRPTSRPRGPSLATPLLSLILGLAVSACAHRGGSTAAMGPRHDTIPLYRPFPDSDKVYVEADVGDGQRRVFMVDTGASVSVITTEVAEAVGLEVVDQGESLVGLGGRAVWRRATLPGVKIGAYTIPQIEVAVGVPGVPTTAGLAPVAGILGNNVWGRFQVAIDYRANELELARPGALTLPDDATPMTFNGQHISTSVTLLAGPPDNTLSRELTLEVDTGARGLVVSGATGAGLEPVTTVGEEVILGVGAGDDVPMANFIRTTRRAPVQRIEIGGSTVEGDLELTWLNFDEDIEKVGPPEMRGLVGYQVLADKRVIFDYPGSRISVRPSTRRAHSYDLHERMLGELRGHRDLESMQTRATLLAILGREDAADKMISRVLRREPGDPSATVLRARILRSKGEPEAALDILRPLSPADLVDKGEIVAVVNGLWLSGDPGAALALAEQATEASPEVAESWLALSDARRVAGDLEGARLALREANRRDELPEGHLLRRAWIASLEGDALAAISYARRLLDRSPTWGATLWLYGIEAAAGGEAGMLAADVDRALGRLHPGDQPLDFAAMAMRLTGDQARANALAEQGQLRDCAKVKDASRANCDAWYLAMSGADLETARARVLDAIAAAPERSEYQDTLATVNEALGRLTEARDAAWKAASLNPDDVYLLWQASRLDAAAKAQKP